LFYVGVNSYLILQKLSSLRYKIENNKKKHTPYKQFRVCLGRDRMVVGFYDYICNKCLSTLMLWVRISIRARCTTLCDKVCQWLTTARWFSPEPLVSSTNKTDLHDIAEILLKVALSTINQTNKHTVPKLNRKVVERSIIILTSIYRSAVMIHCRWMSPHFLNKTMRFIYVVVYVKRISTLANNWVCSVFASGFPW
jgi:hypothetical protein